MSEKEHQNTTNNQILPFVIPNLGPAARNSDGGETTDDRQIETKRRGRKYEYPAELTFQFIGGFCRCFIICEVDKVGTQILKSPEQSISSL